MRCTPFTHTAPIRRLPLGVGDQAALAVLDVDVETLGVVPAIHVYERLEPQRWRITAANTTFEFEVDEFGVANDISGHFRRVL